jgi:hypothetical protein
MPVETLLPPYTKEERSRELSMRSRALRWRMQRALKQGRRLGGQRRQLLDKGRDALTLLEGKEEEDGENHPPVC